MVGCESSSTCTPVIFSHEYQKMLQRQKQERLKPGPPEGRNHLAQKHEVERLDMRKLLVCDSTKTRPPGSSYIGIDPSGARKSRTELVMTRRDHCFPAYRVAYRLRSEVPDPFGDSRRSLQTCEDYSFQEYFRGGDYWATVGAN